MIQDLQGAGCSRLGFFILIQMWSLMFDTSVFLILPLYLDFEECKEYPCPSSPYLGLWRTMEVPDWGLGLGLGTGWVGSGLSSVLCLAQTAQTNNSELSLLIS